MEDLPGPGLTPEAKARIKSQLRQNLKNEQKGS